jgi:hypothetical protein
MTAPKPNAGYHSSTQGWAGATRLPVPRCTTARVADWRPVPDLSPAPALFNPSRDQALLSTGGDEQLSSGLRSRLVQAALVETELDARLLGQQVRAVAGNLAQLGDRCGDLVLGGRAPAGMPPGDAGDPGHQQPVMVWCTTIMSHHTRIEHGNDKRKGNGQIVRIS